MTERGLSRFSIDVLSSGQGEILVNDQDISDAVAGFSVQCNVGQPPILTLKEAGGSGTIKGEGIVRVMDDRVAAKEVIIRFLHSVDPSRLDAAVLERSEFGSSPMETAIEVLLEWARNAR